MIPDKPARLNQLEAQERQLTNQMRFKSAFDSMNEKDVNRNKAHTMVAY